MGKTSRVLALSFASLLALSACTDSTDERSIPPYDETTGLPEGIPGVSEADTAADDVTEDPSVDGSEDDTPSQLGAVDESDGDTTNEVSVVDESEGDTVSDVPVVAESEGDSTGDVPVVDESDGVTTTEAPVVDDSDVDTTVAPTTTPVVPDPEDGAPLDEPTVEFCQAPVRQGHFVDVALDDADGGLNVRSGAGAANPVIYTLPRGKELITTGNCIVVAGVDWWEVTGSDGSRPGWVSSKFLSDGPLRNPGLGNPVADTANEGLVAETLDEMLEIIADSYGFDEDRTITEIEVVGGDSQGGEGTWEITGFKDDSVDGFRVDIVFLFEKDANAEKVIGFRAGRVTNYPMCGRGVSGDGLCI